MSGTDPRSPWLGGPGARWAQALLLALHVALLAALVLCVRVFLGVLPRLDFETWQTVAFLAGAAVSFAYFGARTVRIGRDLWGARRPAEVPDPGDPPEG